MEKEEIGRGCSEPKPFGEKQEFRVGMISHWLNCSCGGFFCGRCSAQFFLLGPVVDDSVLWGSILLRSVTGSCSYN